MSKCAVQERIDELKSAAIQACWIIESWVTCETQFPIKEHDPDWNKAESIRTLVAKPDPIVASNDEILDVLDGLVKHIRKVGGYMVPEDQNVLFKAESVLREAGRQA